jgi:hypothetical protein
MPYYRNNSNQKVYKLIDGLVIDATNGQDNTLMVLYKCVDRGTKYVRERNEFHQKFTLLKNFKIHK